MNMTTRFRLNVFVAAVCVGLLVCAVSAVATAETVTFKQGATNAFSTDPYSGTEDAKIATDPFSTGNYGGLAQLDHGLYGSVFRSLIRFDLSDFSGEYATITSVTLRLYVLDISKAADQTNTSQLYMVGTSNTGWGEGAATWDYPAVSQTWTGGEGLGEAGEGYAATPVASVTWTKANYANGDAVDFMFTGTTAELTAIIDSFTSPTNAGMILRYADETSGATKNMFRLHSSESTAAYRPELIVGYSVPEPATMAMLGLGGMMMLVRRRRNK